MSAARPTWIGTSWKMTKTLAEASAWADAVARVPAPERVRRFVVPPSTALHQVAGRFAGTDVLVGAQDAHWEDAGPWTGEVSVPQVADAGARLVELGHSERRQHLGDTDDRVAAKLAAVVRHGLLPLLCVGEDADTRARGRAVDHVLGQLARALGGVDPGTRLLVAYEPVWAIGAGGTRAAPEQVAPVLAAVRAAYGDRLEALLYGGSVDVRGAPELLEVPEVDGLFVGRSAWDAAGFLRLVELAGERRTTRP